MLVAQIAYSQLSEKTKRNADSLVKFLPDVRQSTPAVTPRPYDFITAACWMDDVRGASQYNHLSTLHYINVPCGGKPQDVKVPSALSAISNARSTLLSTGATPENKVVALAILLHVVGDIHQPLHCIDRDLGGNTFPISGVPEMEARLRRDGKAVDRNRAATGENAPVYQRLHAFWDSAYRYDVVSQNGQRRVVQLYFSGSSSQPDEKRIAQVSSDITSRFHPTAKDVGDQRFSNWITESNEIACAFAFQFVQPKSNLSPAYVIHSHDISSRSIVLAGHRLAGLLNLIFNSNEELAVS